MWYIINFVPPLICLLICWLSKDNYTKNRAFIITILYTLPHNLYGNILKPCLQLQLIYKILALDTQSKLCIWSQWLVNTFVIVFYYSLSQHKPTLFYCFLKNISIIMIPRAHNFLYLYIVEMVYLEWSTTWRSSTLNLFA